LFAPPNVPVERVEALRFAFQQLTEDAEFAAAFETTVKGRLSPSTGAVLEEFVSQALDTPAAIVAETKRILGLDD
jgi:tripartite-type tricarboxylate transporter receptor subunit TctC